MLGAKVRLCAPRTLLPAGVESWPVDVYGDLNQAVRDTDAVMCLRLQLERQQMQTELSRLADVCRNESVPDAFQTFVAGIPTLTKTERRIFDGYAAGLRTREIAQQLDIKDSTLRFHNKNIYDKLGVSSLKQLQQFVAILNSGSGSTPDENAPPKGR